MRRVLLLATGTVALSALCAWLILVRHPLVAGLAAALAAAPLVVMRLPARIEGGSRDRFAEQVLDRVFEASILVPLAWVARAGSNRDAVLALVGLGASYLASYQRARGQALGYRGEEGLGYRVARSVVLVGGLLTGWIEASLWIFAALALGAAGARTRSIVLQERDSAGMPESP